MINKKKRKGSIPWSAPTPCIPFFLAKMSEEDA